MKKTLLSFSVFLSALFNVQTATAQCEPVISPSTVIMCPNTTDTLWSDVHDTYQWMKDGVVLSGETNQYIVIDYFNSVGFTYEVITTTTGCTGPDTSDGVFVDGWNFLPPFVIHVTDMFLCPGIPDTVIMEFSYDENIQWFFNGNPIPGATDDTLIATALGSYTVEGAPSVCPNYIVSLGMNLDITYNQPPFVTPDSLELCAGASDTLNTGFYNAYQWYQNGLAILNDTLPYTIVNTPGYYHVTTTEEACVLSSDSTYVYMHNTIVPVIVQTLGNQLLATPTAQLSNFQWYLNGNPISGANDSTYTPTASGTYTVSAFDGTCSDTSASYQYTLSVQQLGANANLRIYPNPASTEVHVNCAVAVRVVLFDNLGRLVYASDKAATTHTITTDKLPKGIYTLKLTGSNSNMCEKIVLE